MYVFLVFFFEAGFKKKIPYSHIYFGFTLLNELEFPSFQDSPKLERSYSKTPLAFSTNFRHFSRPKEFPLYGAKSFDTPELNPKGFKNNYLFPFFMFCSLFQGLLLSWLFGRSGRYFFPVSQYQHPSAVVSISSSITSNFGKVVESSKKSKKAEVSPVSAQSAGRNPNLGSSSSSFNTSQPIDTLLENSDQTSLETSFVRKIQKAKSLGNFNVALKEHQNQLAYSRTRRFTTELKLRSLVQAWNDVKFIEKCKTLRNNLSIHFLDIQHQACRESKLHDRFTSSLEQYKIDQKVEKDYLTNNLQPLRATRQKAQNANKCDELLEKKYQDARTKCQELRDQAEKSFAEMKNASKLNTQAKNSLKKSCDVLFEALREIKNKKGLTPKRKVLLAAELKKIHARYQVCTDFKITDQELDFIRGCVGETGRDKLLKKYNVFVDPCAQTMADKMVKTAGRDVSFEGNEKSKIVEKEVSGRLINSDGFRPFDVEAYNAVSSLTVQEAECLFGFINKLCHFAVVGLDKAKGEKFEDFVFSRPLVDFVLTYTDSQDNRKDQNETPMVFHDLFNCCMRASPEFFQNPDLFNKFPGKNFSIKLGNLSPQIPATDLEPTIQKCLNIAYPLPGDLDEVTSGHDLQNYNENLKLKYDEADAYLKTAVFPMEKHHLINKEAGGTNTSENGLGLSKPAHGMSHCSDEVQRLAIGKPGASANLRAAGSRVKLLEQIITDKETVLLIEQQRIENETI